VTALNLSSDPAAAQGCVANIGPRERAKRMRFGVIGLAAGAALAAAMVALGLDRGWRLGLFFVFAAAATGLFQALDKT
jgi:hypothetical protein